MKVAIPLGLLLLVGIVACLQRVPGRPDVPERRGPVKQEDAPEPVREQARPGPEPVSQAAGSPSVPTVPKVAAPAAPAWKKPFGILDQALQLTAAQQRAVEQILQDRETEIRSFHDAIRKAGFLDLRDFDWQVGLLKASWYGKMDALLDAGQHVAFLSLVEKGIFNEGLAFLVEPGMTILD